MSPAPLRCPCCPLHALPPCAGSRLLRLTLLGRSSGYEIRIEQADARSCAALLGAEAFDLIIDKGTLDALLCDDDEATRLESARLECDQVRTMLRCGGCFCLVTPKYPDEEGAEESFEAGELGGTAPWLRAAIAGLCGTDTCGVPSEPAASDGGESAAAGCRWSLEIHISSQDVPNVYLFRKLRRSPRGAAGAAGGGAAAGIEISVLTHGDDEEDGMS